jgi:hypothetical protein
MESSGAETVMEHHMFAIIVSIFDALERIHVIDAQAPKA